MSTFQNKFDLIIKDFCKEIASVYSLDENELFSLWNKGSSSSPVTKKDSSSSSSSSIKTDISKPSVPEKVEEDPDLEITKEKILVANKDVLAAMCKKKGLKMSGKKDELVQRLIESLSSSSSSSSSSSVSKPSSSSKKEEPSVIKSVKSTVSDIAIRKNKYGNFEHMQTGLVFGTDKKVYGRQVEGEVVPLTTEDIETCKRYKFVCKLPENLNVNKSLDDIKIDDVEQEEDELDDEELVEDLEDEDEDVIDDEDK